MRRSGENGFGSEFFVIFGTGFEGRGGFALLYSTGSIFDMGGVCEREGRLFLAEYAFIVEAPNKRLLKLWINESNKALFGEIVVENVIGLYLA